MSFLRSQMYDGDKIANIAWINNCLFQPLITAAIFHSFASGNCTAFATSDKCSILTNLVVTIRCIFASETFSSVRKRTEPNIDYLTYAHTFSLRLIIVCTGFPYNRRPRSI